MIGDVIQIATQLSYLERAQVMVVMSALPTDIHNTTLNIEGLNDLKEYLIMVKKAYGQSTSQEVTVGAFSMEKFVEDYTTQVNSNDMSKLISKMESLQTFFKPFKIWANTNLKSFPIEAGIMLNPMTTLLISVDLMVERNSLVRTILGILGSNLTVEVGVDSKKSPNIRRLNIAIKTPDKDKMRCQYCQEIGIGHVAKECKKRTRGLEQAT